MEIKIRTASEQDIDALDKLYYDFHQYHVHKVPNRLRDLGKIEDQDWSRLNKALREIFRNANAVIFVAEVSSHVVGLVEVYFRPDDETNPLIIPKKAAYLQSIFVSENFRKLGVGKRLIHAAQAWSREKGAKEMKLDVWEFNVEAKKFYSEMGFSYLSRTMITDL